jgi:hypothetical protein
MFAVVLWLVLPAFGVLWGYWQCFGVSALFDFVVSKLRGV